MKKVTKLIAVAIVTGTAALCASTASAWWGNDYYDGYYGPWGGGPWGGWPGGSSWGDDWFGDGWGDFSMSMSGGGHGRGWNRYNSYYGPYGWGGYPYGGYGYPYGGYGYPYAAPVAPVAPAAPATK